ncbi:rhamnan synthesis F family protein [Propionispira raffinosivorans]|uniref:rhamnan synthesis F family protein n=1 Tax=Propionispira raffinosivorans TaxID=86959 RepID=UPI0003605D30|nr:rhamnan synthesis F family protein [Propionispira raffinosivorans]
MSTKRIAIFQMYDKDGIIDNYIIYLLKEIRTVANRLVVVCNGEIKPEYIERIKIYTDDIYMRGDLGGDAGAYKEALNQFIGWNNIYGYDELILSNDTYYGPFEKFKKIFGDMQSRSELDFWGITKMSETDNVDFGYIPKHLQAYFVVVRKRLLHSSIFKGFWERDIGKSNIYKDAVSNFEHAFTVEFEKAGYQWNAYVNMDIYDSARKKNNFPHYFFRNGELIYRYHCPTLKRKVFTCDDRIFQYSGHEDLRKSIEYIDKKTNYDVNMIWENLLRVYNVVDLKESLHLNYILPINRLSSPMKSDDKVIIFNMIYQEQVEQNFTNYVATLSNDTPIIIVIRDGEDASLLKERCLATGKKQYNIVIYNGKSILGWISGQAKILSKYKYICIVNDYRAEKKESILIGETFKCNNWNNLIQNDDYIENVIELFEKNSKMGFLAPPEPYHAHFFAELGDTWVGCFDETKVLSQNLGLNCNLSIVKNTFGYAGSFWCRTEILTALFKKKFSIDQWLESKCKDTRRKALYRILIYMSQSAGFYSATVETTEYASVANVDLQYLLQKLVTRAQVEFGHSGFVSFTNTWRDKQMIEFARRHKKLYIYGAGDYGMRAYRILTDQKIKVDGFLISDGHKIVDTDTGISIQYISEIKFTDDIGVIIAVIELVQGVLLQEARKYNCSHIFPM